MSIASIPRQEDLLIALVLGLSSILDPTGVLHGDDISGSGRGTGTLLENGLLDTHVGG